MSAPSVLLYSCWILENDLAFFSEHIPMNQPREGVGALERTGVGWGEALGEPEEQ